MGVTNEIVRAKEVGSLSQADIQTLAKAGVIPANTPNDQVFIFAKICKERGLSPFSKEIYLVEYKGRYSTIVGINGFRRLAVDTGEYAGCDDAKYDLKSDGSFKTAADLSIENKTPTSCTVTVYRIVQGVRVAYTHTALFKEFSTGQQKWATMPFQMLEKVAEAFALRKGFSDRLTGLSTPEEMGAIHDEQAIVLPSQPGQGREDMIALIKGRVQSCETRADLQRLYEANPNWTKDADITQLFIDYSTEKGWNKK